MTALSLQHLPTSDDPHEVLAHCPASIAGLPITVLPIPSEADVQGEHHALPCIFVAQQGHGLRSYERSGRTVNLRTAPRMIEIYEAGLSFDRSRWQGKPGRCVMIEFNDRDVESMTHGALRSLDLRTHHELFDDRLSRLTLELANEVLSENPGGELYVQGLCVTLLGALSQQYSTSPSSQYDAAQARKLSTAQQRRLTDLVKQELSSKLSLSRLSAEVRLSPQHFARLFKASFGVTAHEYVMQARVDAVVQALREGRFPSIAEAALACGFASHSHMTEVLRRRLGTTPSELRHQSRS